MTIIFFSGNLHKAREIEAIFSSFKVRLYTDFIKSFEVIENGKSFSDNAKIKLNALKNAIQDNLLDGIGNDFILMAEDSGICVESLDNLPNIFSARFANLPKDLSMFSKSFDAIKSVDSSDSANIARLISELKMRNISESKAQFISCVACFVPYSKTCLSNNSKSYLNLLDGQILTTHGFLNGKVITEIRGENGFGYDPIFIPNGFECTLAEMPSMSKNALSHRKIALDLMRLILK